MASKSESNTVSTAYEEAKKRIFVLDKLRHRSFGVDGKSKFESYGHGSVYRKTALDKELDEQLTNLLEMQVTLSRPIAKSRNPLTPRFRKYYASVIMYWREHQSDGRIIEDFELHDGTTILLDASKLAHTNRTKDYGSFKASIEGDLFFPERVAEKVYSIIRETVNHFIDCYPQDLAIVEQHELLPPSVNSTAHVAKNRL